MFLTTKQVADRLNIPVATLRGYIRRGFIRCGKRPGQSVYAFSTRQLEDAIQQFEKGDFDHADVAATPSKCGAAR